MYIHIRRCACHMNDVDSEVVVEGVDRYIRCELYAIVQPK